MKTGIELIAIERQEQIEKHGRSIQNDIDRNDRHQLPEAAAILAYPFHYAIDNEDTPFGWDTDDFNRMMIKPTLERLIIAGALICAEIDRLNAKGL